MTPLIFLVAGAMTMDMGDMGSMQQNAGAQPAMAQAVQLAQAPRSPQAAQAPQASQASQATQPPQATPPASPAQASLDELKKLFGRWEAPMGNGKTIVDTFQPFALGTAILAEEWVDGQQITTTVFYIVGSELRADHYCDYLNQPHYVARPTTDPSVIDLEFRDATNLDTHPRHFHSTTWHVVDATHLTQDWQIEGGPKGSAKVHFDFVRTSTQPS